MRVMCVHMLICNIEIIEFKENTQIKEIIRHSNNSK